MSAQCRFCDHPLTTTFLDLGFSPIANNYLTPEELSQPEVHYSLCTYVCSLCLLVQLPNTVERTALFHKDYAYFSSYSSTWLEHSQNYATAMIQHYKLTEESLVIEVASNDGYLLDYFIKASIPVLGIDPAASVAQTAIEKGIPTRIAFFGKELAKKLLQEQKVADLLIANNVLAHVPDLNDFIAGFKLLLNQDGIATFEFPHLLALITTMSFDTIYHEHYSYFSLHAVETIFAHHGLTVFHLEELRTHGGSLRIFACHTGSKKHVKQESIKQFKEKEKAAGLDTINGYKHFQNAVQARKHTLLKELTALKEAGKTIVGYGAPAKGNTLLNYCGIRTDFIDYTVDRNPHKQGLYLPGTHIPIKAVEALTLTKPDVIIILPWNLKDEIIGQLKPICTWNPYYLIPIDLSKDCYAHPTSGASRGISHNA